MTIKMRSVKLLDAYGQPVKTDQTRMTTTTLGGKHSVLSFEIPQGYLTPKKIIHMEDVQPCYTDTFVMINPSHLGVSAPGIDGLEEACRLNLREASKSTLLGGKQLSSWIEWQEPLRLRNDRGWFNTLKAPGSLLDALNKTGSMVEVPGTLHHPHKPNFALVASFKTRHRLPVLQVTLWRDLGEWVTEVDIDLKQGLKHWGEVVRNHLTGGQTHPYVVNQLMAWYWGVVSFKLEVPTAKPG